LVFGWDNGDEEYRGIAKKLSLYMQIIRLDNRRNTSYFETLEDNKGELDIIAFRGKIRCIEFWISLSERFHLITCELISQD
jgi:hypothetical protein